MAEESPEVQPETWAIVEKMGHVSLAGRLTEEERFGGKMGRVDVPQPDGTFATHYFASQSIYGVTIVTEAAARKSAERSWPRPVTPYEPRAISGPRFEGDHFIDEDDVDFGDERDDELDPRIPEGGIL